ncbi:MAG: sugar isomerase domain-containing protein [Anaerolineaceae bacterium]|nr:sugar isomerase domain-containing protein [Anaerolineaceae bacterium]
MLLAAGKYHQIIKALMKSLVVHQEAAICAVSDQMVQTIRSGHKIYLFGSGHSALLSQSAQLRGGGLANVVPILVTNLMVHENSQLSSLLEKTPGIAAQVLARYEVQTGDMLFVVSNSGVNAVPVEIARLAKERGALIVAICAFAYASANRRGQSSAKLVDSADFILDNGSQKGDAVLNLPQDSGKVCPSSTLINEFIWQCLVAECTSKLVSLVKPLPIYQSLNFEGAAAHNERLVQKMRAFNPHL